ncbi:MAG: membrane protein insertase YidC [Gammaproteobacteria bacterium]|nr:membrane protein insertase YidC [Gammaproteobacteria bacterium]NIQ12196.1 membrane protein insertase YidC [Gammaproteobacteria bacterium]NIQ75034.1 membrane protein insertase YidC [Gammaproteobacteria bacterium]NIR26067.1 membrane protein insertase YidC [Gammaproteobacteria bacterium]NIR95892.1 membrane protein insertase YidC [Gammaproteobacteria bacterium]
MEKTRLILVVALSLVIMLLWDAWQRDYGSLQTIEQVRDQEQTTAPTMPADLPEIEEEASEPVIAVENRETGETIEVQTDLLRLLISTKGGTIVQTDLLDYPQSLDQMSQPVRLLNNNSSLVYIAQGGLLSKVEAPTHTDTFTSLDSAYQLEPGQDVLEVPLLWMSASGLRVKKIYEFHRNEYLIRIRYEVQNNSDTGWAGRVYNQLQRSPAPGGGRGMIYTYTGAILSSEENRYEKISLDDIAEEKLSRSISGGWAAMIQHYFVTALVPGMPDQTYQYYTNYLDPVQSGLPQKRYVIGMYSPQQTIAAGYSGTFSEKLYLGPKIQSRLEKIAPNLELTVDYGMLWFIAKPLFWCLQQFHKYTNNWGWAIILVTLMLKLLFYYLSAAGYRSMANMRRVQPRLMSIKERYKNDRARLNKAMMDLYKEEKINPLGGCFPILVQIPVFIALYWVLLESVELRQSGFIFWLKDLSTPDPYFVLPIVMGITMFIQQKLNPAPMDPVQEKVMMSLPFVFTVFFAFFPSGLVLYWVVNNILSIAQQWLIIRNIERASQKPRSG